MRPELKDLVIEVIDTCNARCVMCNIWKNEDEHRVPDVAVEQLPTTLTNINISGGEPFLRADLSQLVARIKKRCPKVRIIISSNGFLPERIESQMRDILKVDPEVGVGISIDGRDGLHDRIRGIPNGFRKCMETVRRLKGLGVGSLRLAFTATEANVAGLAEVHRLAKEVGAEFSCAVAHNSGIYFRTNENNTLDAEVLRGQLNAIGADDLRGWKIKRWVRAFFYQGLLDKARDLPRRIPCTAAGKSAFLSSSGHLHPCNMLETRLGDLRTQSFEDIWSSENTEEVRRFAPTCSVNCWMVCTARESIKAHPLAVMRWVAAGKMRAHTGREIYQ
ncbi:MAG TPA: radical SAM protein [Candidatus Polarisedimenticolia bacterium]|jgi:MoaA/NifB/PqqE/SkfB family radical SAM enzyme|nr:radical SAM protein [Candidatus Polarisedimenticolia bacterium]